MTETDYAVDRISDLPRDILNKILSYMPLRDAVRTSTLSSQWRYKWTTIPDLVFDRYLERFLNRHNMEAVVDQVLSHHDGAITRFAINNCHIQSYYSVGRWLSYLSNHGIKSLEFSPKYLNMVPVPLTGFDQLRHLLLGISCVVKIPPSWRGLNQLIALQLIQANIEDGDLHLLLSKCPKIKHLDLRIRSQGGIKELPNKLDHLTDLDLGTMSFVDLGNIKLLLSLIKSSPNLRSLRLYNAASIGENGVTEYLKAQDDLKDCLGCLEDVMIHLMMDFPAEVELVKLLLRSAPVLEKVDIYTSKSHFDAPIREFKNTKCASSKVKIIVHTNFMY
ncbi:F-box/FBD/LRR-repeat protein At1g13570-like [Andrographis paniculata]|uniref:F-box/FBD/LRR-repeat protein At1g13570-like n=1 Tax=Andrographis paniculata TaxID=175694 RepID=UPI0021E87B46|nr:F-box/FBD/LRR-repeat protein At1g13570-like [Andrographis paniculata]XP_051127501.1 F-box/FBD/LRR-repeat protein At1g13570-like [Andrographis paniculata]